jgi:putative addiction module component (TIGR02574 family)
MAARTTLLDEALDLPIDERVELAAKLLESLPEQPPVEAGEVEAAWATEIRRRVGRMLDGEATASSWPDARTRILARLARRCDY